MKNAYKTGERVFYLSEPAVVRDAPQDSTDEFYVIAFPSGRPDAMVRTSEVDALLKPLVDPYLKSQAMEMARELDQFEERLEEIAENWAVEHGMTAVEHKLNEARGPLRSARDAAHQYATGVLLPEED